jgi:hypothetical protein
VGDDDEEDTIIGDGGMAVGDNESIVEPEEKFVKTI